MGRVAFWTATPALLGWLVSLYALHTKNKSQDAKIKVLEDGHNDCQRKLGMDWPSDDMALEIAVAMRLLRDSGMDAKLHHVAMYIEQKRRKAGR